MLTREHLIKQPYYDINELDDTLALTCAQRRLIKKHGTLIKALQNGEVLNPSFADLQLLKAIENKAPTNPIAHAWLKYTALRQQQRQLKHTA